MKNATLLIFICLLTACANSPYTVTLNDNVMYSPKPVIDTGVMADPNLQGCLNQAFISQQNNDPEALTLLACPGAGIQSLIGIATLTNLEQLDLSDNVIDDLSPLLYLKKLRVLSVRNNRLGDISSLSSLPILQFISLQGNSNISCRALNKLEEKTGSTLNRPLACH